MHATYRQIKRASKINLTKKQTNLKNTIQPKRKMNKENLQFTNKGIQMSNKHKVTRSYS